MPRLNDVCRYVRSKNAGPFWITVDLFFTPETYDRYRDDPAISAEAFGRLYGAEPDLIKRIPVDDLHVIKFTYPRPTAQGGAVERDMHAGQQYVRLLDLELGADSPAEGVAA